VRIPDVSYARSGDVAIAYQAVGEGAPDLVLLPFLANMYSIWGAPRFEPVARRLAEDRRLVVVNPRGVGLSDRPRGFTVESRMDDIRAVFDDLGVERADVLGLAEAAASCAVLAASYPDRVQGLARQRRGARFRDRRAGRSRRVGRSQGPCGGVGADLRRPRRA
jgi:pimeloyl-ACP methyl ester carboxylesterase